MIGNFDTNNINDKKLEHVKCKNCDPSSKLKIYEYDEDKCLWKLNKIGCKCNCCDNILWSDYVPINEQYKRIVQCEKCEPKSNVIQYRFGGDGWYVKKIKIFENNKHKWINSFTSERICKCNKCTQANIYS